MSFEDRYQLQVPLGETDRGTVWSGVDKKFGRNVAIAVVEDDAPEEIRTRFTEVNEAAKEIRHPAIVRVHDVGTTGDGTPYATMELLEGESLRTRLIDGPPLRLDQAVRAVAEILTGLGKLHAKGQAHGDVCPSNVIVRERAGRVVAKLVGLGLDRARVRAGKEPLDHEGQLLGLAFMSPAQARGEVVADAASDIYSAAAVLYALMTGHLPHYGESEEALREDVKSGPVWPAANMRHEIAGPVADIVTKALGPEPFETADEFAKELRGSLLRMRGVGKLETVAQRPSMARPEERPADPPKNESRPMRPLKKLSLKGPGAAKPFAGKPVVKNKEAEPPATGEERLEFERLSGLLEIPTDGSPPARKMPPPPPDPEEKLEFERLSGLLEVPTDGSAPKRLGGAPPSPPDLQAFGAEDEATLLDAHPGERETGADIDVDVDVDVGEEKPDEEGAKAKGEADDKGEEPEAAEGDDEKPADAEAADDEEPPDEEKVAASTDDEAEAEQPAPKEVAAPDGDKAPEKVEDGASEEKPDDASDDAAPDGAIPGPLEKKSKKKRDSKRPSKRPKKRDSKRPSKRPKKRDSERPAAGSAPPGSEEPKHDPFAPPVVDETPAEPTGEGGGIPIWVWGAFAAAAVIGIVAYAVVNGETDETDRGPTATLPDDPPRSPAADVEEPDIEEPDVEEPDVEEPTLVTLTDVPEGATVWLDDVEMEGTEIEIPADGASHDLEVRLEGHVTWTRSVDSINSLELAVVLEAEEPEEPTADTPPTSDTPPSGRRRRSGEASGRRRRGDGASTRRRRRRTGQTGGRRGRSAGGSPTAVSDPGF